MPKRAAGLQPAGLANVQTLHKRPYQAEAAGDDPAWGFHHQRFSRPFNLAASNCFRRQNKLSKNKLLGTAVITKKETRRDLSATAGFLPLFPLSLFGPSPYTLKQ